MPLTRKELGQHRYELLRCPVGSPVDGHQHPQFMDGDAPDTNAWAEIAMWTAIDGPHLVRAFADDLAMYRRTKSPVSRWRLIMLGFDVLAAFPTQTLPNGAQSLGTMLMNVKRTPGLAKIGVLRQWAHVARAVCAAREAYGKPHRELDVWIKMWVELLWRAQAASGTIGDFEHKEGLFEGQPWTEGSATETQGVCAFWESNFIPRSMLHAVTLLNDPLTSARAQQYVARYVAIWDTAEQVPDENGRGVTGVSRYPITSDEARNVDTKNGLKPNLRERAWDTARAEGEPDVWAVAVRMRVREKLPSKYNRDGELEYVSDAHAVAAEFGVA